MRPPQRSAAGVASRVHHPMPQRTPPEASAAARSRAPTRVQASDPRQPAQRSGAGVASPTAAHPSTSPGGRFRLARTVRTRAQQPSGTGSQHSERRESDHGPTRRHPGGRCRSSPHLTCPRVTRHHARCSQRSEAQQASRAASTTRGPNASPPDALAVAPPRVPPEHEHRMRGSRRSAAEQASRARPRRVRRHDQVDASALARTVRTRAPQTIRREAACGAKRSRRREPFTPVPIQRTQWQRQRPRRCSQRSRAERASERSRRREAGRGRAGVRACRILGLRRLGFCLGGPVLGV
jgi:hypothetical protein